MLNANNYQLALLGFVSPLHFILKTQPLSEYNGCMSFISS